MSKRLHVGDLVQVISGKEKGKQGKITKLMLDDDRVIVEGLNMVTRNQRPRRAINRAARSARKPPSTCRT